MLLTDVTDNFFLILIKSLTILNDQPYSRIAKSRFHKAKKQILSPGSTCIFDQPSQDQQFTTTTDQTLTGLMYSGRSHSMPLITPSYPQNARVLPTVQSSGSYHCSQAVSPREPDSAPAAMPPISSPEKWNPFLSRGAAPTADVHSAD